MYYLRVFEKIQNDTSRVGGGGVQKPKKGFRRRKTCLKNLVTLRNSHQLMQAKKARRTQQPRCDTDEARLLER
jgi:hypothetical protein